MTAKATWTEMREAIIERDVETCRVCGTQKPDGPWEVDHIVRRTDGGTDEPDNLRLLCHDCHVLVGYEQRGVSHRSPLKEDGKRVHIWMTDEDYAEMVEMVALEAARDRKPVSVSAWIKDAIRHKVERQRKLRSR